MGEKYRNLVNVNFVVGFTGILLLAGIFSVYLINYYNSTSRSGIESMQTITANASSKTQGLIDSMYITFELLDEWIQANPEKDPRFDEDFNHLVDIYREHTHGRIDLRMLTAEGGLYYLPSESTTSLSDISDREYFKAQEGLSSGSLYFAAPVKSRVTGKWGIPITYKLQKNNHNIVVLFAAIEFDIFDEMFEEMLQEEALAFTLVRDDGLVLERSPFDEYILKESLDTSGFEKGYKIVDIYNPEKNSRLLFHDSLEEIPIGIIVGMSFEEAKSTLYNAMIIRIIMAVVILLSYFFVIKRSSSLIARNNTIKDQLEKAARFDSLTGMRNRSYFFERAHDEMERARRYNGKMVMLMLDVDHFKLVNDTWGHHEGDRILNSMAEIIENEIRASDISGRIGGEEFAILLPDTGIEAGKEVAERILKQARTVILNTWTGSFSIGAAEWKGNAETVEHLLKRSDTAMYAAKRAGRNRLVFQKI